MDSRIVIFDGEQFEARYTFDIDNQTEGVDIYYIIGKDKKYIGNIEGLTLDDEDDSEQLELFDIIVIGWLQEQDVNYTMGK